MEFGYAVKSVSRVGGPPPVSLQGMLGRLQVEDSGKRQRRINPRVAHVQSVYSATIDNSTVISSGFPPAKK